ncbi:MAG TPA: succinate--CoA ligase subunit alpha [Actinomycetota bacterium]|nr:succinate--CoA ligase subunit alpha [Actinomycetota bacterium]
MGIFLGAESRVLVQGLTGEQGKFHSLRNRGYGTKIVAGVTPGKGGQTVEGIPVFNNVAEGAEQTGADVAVIYVPARSAPDAILESIDAKVPLIVCITEGIPANDMARVYSYLSDGRHCSRLIGPNCPGLISPGSSNVGIIPGEITAPGPVGMVSRSGTLTYQIMHELTQLGVGQTTTVGIGGDPIVGTNFIDCLGAFEEDPETEVVVLMGEIGGDEEEKAAEFISAHMKTPVVAYVAGYTAPEGRRMGHAGAIVSGSKGTAAAKAQAFERAGVRVGRNSVEVAQLVKSALG